MENQRVARTKGYLKEAIIELLRTVPFENITIKAICAKADVNRSTFYAYYSCPRDLIDEIEGEILSKLPDFDPWHRPFLDSLIPFMEYIRANGEKFRILMTSSVDTSFGEQVISAVMDKYSDTIPYDDEEERRMSMIFCVDGIVGMIREWILSGFRWPVERISSLIVDIAFRSVGFNHDKGFGSRKLRHS